MLGCFAGKVIRMNGARLRQHCHRVPLSARKHPLRKSQCQRLALVKSQHTARAIRFQRAGRSESDTALPVVAFNLQVTSYLLPLLQAHHLIAAEAFTPPPPRCCPHPLQDTPISLVPTNVPERAP